jgi:hypothetical protein
MELARVSRAPMSAACAAAGSVPVLEAFVEEDRTVRFAMAFTFLVSIRQSNSLPSRAILFQ